MRIPRLTAVSDAAARRRFGIEDFDRWLDRLSEVGVDAVQIREKDEPADRLFERVRRAVDRVGDRLQVWVNGRADVAVAAAAHGVHLPSRGLPVAPLRRRFGKHLGIGLATHDLDEIVRARQDGADYVTFSPIYDTPSKRAHGAPQGLDRLRQAVEVGLPVVALGGLDAERFAEVREAGAAGAAAIRAFHDPASLEKLGAHR